MARRRAPTSLAIMTPAKTSIVIVEDSDDLRELIGFMFERDGFRVVTCSDADSGFEAVRRERPDVVLTDLMLGASSGLELITRLRSDLASTVPPIVACSGFTSFEGEALLRGAEDFVLKPFELPTLRRAVARALAHRLAGESERADALRRSHEMRTRALALAREALTRLDPHMDDLRRRVNWTTAALPRYFGFGSCFVALLRANGLCVFASSDAQRWPVSHAVELAPCRDILESSSLLVASDLSELGAAIAAPDGSPLRFFAGVPLACDTVAVGVLCLADDRPRRFARADLSIVDGVGARASAVLTDGGQHVAPVWSAGGLSSREGLTLHLRAELSRTQRRALWIALFVFRGRRPRAVELAPRTLLAELAADAFALLLVRDDAALLPELAAAVRRLHLADSFVAGGLVTIEGGAAGALDENNFLRAAESLAAQSARGGRGKIERLAIRRDTGAVDLMAPPSDLEAELDG